MKKIFERLISYLAVLLFLLSPGCYSELENLELGNIQWSPELGVPLVDSKFTLIDILAANDSSIDFSTDDNNTLILSFSDDNLFKQPASEYYYLSDRSLEVPPISLTQQEISFFNQNGQVVIEREFELDYPPYGNLDEIVIDEGLVPTIIEENFPANLNLSFPMAVPAGNLIINFSEQLNYFGGEPTSNTERSNPFGDVSFTFNADPSLAKISFVLELELTRVDQDLVLGSNALELNLSLIDLEFGALYGDLEQVDLSTDDNTIETNFFSDNELLSNIDYYFENPQFSIVFTNAMGAPVLFDINCFVVNKDGAVASEPINNSVELPAATETLSQVAEQNYDNIFKNLINVVPDSLSIQIGGIIDPENTEDNFVTRDSYIQVGYQIVLPLEFSLSGLEINETVALDGLDPEELQYAFFKFVSENSLPVDLEFTANLLDQDSAFVMNLFDNQLLGSGTEMEPMTLSDIIKLVDNAETTENELEDLSKVKRVGIRATLATTNNGDELVRITSEAAVQFNLTVQAKYNVNL